MWYSLVVNQIINPIIGPMLNSKTFQIFKTSLILKITNLDLNHGSSILVNPIIGPGFESKPIIKTNEVALRNKLPN